MTERNNSLKYVYLTNSYVMSQMSRKNCNKGLIQVEVTQLQGLGSSLYYHFVKHNINQTSFSQTYRLQSSNSKGFILQQLSQFSTLFSCRALQKPHGIEYQYICMSTSFFFLNNPKLHTFTLTKQGTSARDLTFMKFYL